MKISKNWFSMGINKIDRPVTQLDKGKRRSKSTESKGTGKHYNKHWRNSEYYKEIFLKPELHQVGNLKEMNEFLDSAKPPKLNQEVKNLNRPLTNDIEMLTKSYPCEKVQAQKEPQQNSTRHWRKIYSLLNY